MSLLTKATVQSSRSRGPQAMAVLGLVMMTMIITGMLLVHVQLRLKVKDLDIETPKWQREMQRSTNELNQLRSDIEKLKDGNRVLEYAQVELGMVTYNPGQAETLRVDEKRIEEWKRCSPKFEKKRLGFGAREVAMETLEAKRDESLQTIMKILRTPSASTQ